jgi:hypothetical protein
VSSQPAAAAAATDANSRRLTPAGSFSSWAIGSSPICPAGSAAAAPAVARPA